MARPLRILYEDAFYHVMNRGRGRQQIFHGAAYYEDFLQSLSEAHRRFNLEIHAYCLMGNHYHLLVKTPQGNLSRAMRHINGVYTQRYNQRKGTDGPLFRGRYKAILIDAASYLLQVSRYIHRNPIETKQPIVERLTDYPWSSYAAYINQAKAADWLYRDSVYGELGSPQRYRAYRRYVESGIDQETRDFYTGTQTPSVWGDQTFKAFAKDKLETLDTEMNTQDLKPVMPLPEIVRQVADYYEMAEQDIRVTKRGQGRKNIPRWMAMKLCQELGGARLTDIAEHFEVGHYSTVSQTIRRLNALMQEEKRVKKDYDVLSQDLTP